MRERIFKEHGSADPWNLKHARGGMVEIEFIAQYLHAAPTPPTSRGCWRPSHASRRSTRRGEAGLLPSSEARSLPTPSPCIRRCWPCCACRSASASTRQTAPPRLLEALVRAAGRGRSRRPPPAISPSCSARLVESQEAVRQIFDRALPARGGGDLTRSRGTTMTRGRRPGTGVRPADRWRRHASPRRALSGQALRASTSTRRTTRPAAPRRRCGFSSPTPEFQKLGVEVIGVSQGHRRQPRQVQEEVRAVFPLGSDEDGAVVEALRRLGREEHVRQEVHGHRPLDLPGRPRRPDRARPGAGSRCRAMSRRCCEAARGLAEGKAA